MIDNNIESKICTKCNRELPLNMFSKQSTVKSGLRSSCKECNAKYKRNNKERIAEQSKKYRENNKEKSRGYWKQYAIENKEKVLEKVRLYRENHRDILKIKSKEYRENNKEKIAEYRKNNKERIAEHIKHHKQKNREKILIKSRLYYQNNKDKKREYARKYQKLNREKVNIISQRRYARKLNLVSNLTIKEWNDIKEYFNNCCAYCGQEGKLEQDHFIAISNGGEYTINNILPSCRTCNASKNDKDFFQWFPSYKHYDKKRERQILKFLNYNKEIQQLTLIK